MLYKELEKFRYHEFSSGSTTGDDYKEFERKYRNYLKNMCKTYDWELAKFNKNHYEFSAFIKNEEGKYVYLSISDVRFFPREWEDHILIRRADSPTDYTGGANFYSSLILLDANIELLFEKIR